MEVYQKPVTKNHKKRNIAILLIVALIAVILFLGNEQIIPLFNQGNVLTETDCQEKISVWCTECFSLNPGFEVWDISGNKIGEDLAKCSNKYFQTGWTSEQDCIGNAV